MDSETLSPRGLRVKKHHPSPRQTVKWLSTLGLAGALILTGCAGGQTAESEGIPVPTTKNQEVENLTIGVIPVGDFVPVLVAIDEGYFEEEGLNVETQIIQNAASIAPSVLNGQLQFGTAAVPPFIFAIEKGLPLTAMANTSSVTPDAETDPTAILVNDDSEIQSPRDLAGKTVAVNALGSVIHITTAAAIEADGGDHTQTTFVAMPFPDMVAALERSAIDAATLSEPFYIQAVENGARAIGHPNSKTLTPNGTYTLLFTSQEFAEANPEIVDKVKRAVDKASLATANDPSLARAALISHANLDPELAEKMRLPDFSDQLNAESIAQTAELMLELNMLSNPIDVASAIWNQ